MPDTRIVHGFKIEKAVTPRFKRGSSTRLVPLRHAMLAMNPGEMIDGIGYTTAHQVVAAHNNQRMGCCMICYPSLRDHYSRMIVAHAPFEEAANG